MSQPESPARRRLLRRIAVAVPLAVIAGRARRAVGAALLSVADPEAKAVQYVEDASQAKGATAGSSCANCALYLGTKGSSEGGCQLFTGKDVKAAGWCSSWAPQM